MAKAKDVVEKDQVEFDTKKIKAEEKVAKKLAAESKAAAPVEVIEPVEGDPDPVILDACVTLGGEASYSFGDEPLSKMEQKELAAVLINELKKI